MSELKPLLVRVEPLPGESLMSLLVRACDANVFDHPRQILRYAGVQAKAHSAPFAMAGRAAAVANVLGVHASAVAERLHEPTATASTRVGWNGLALERRFIDATVRRVAPESLKRSPHHRTLWTHKALSFCPETFQYLMSSCVACGGALRWGRTRGLTRCESCNASLCDQHSPLIPEKLRGPAGAAAELICHDTVRRNAALKTLSPAFQTWPAAEAFTAVIRFGTAWEAPYLRVGEPTAQRLGAGRLSYVTPQHLASGYAVLANWPSSFAALVDRIGKEQTELLLEPAASLRLHGVFHAQFASKVKSERFAKLLRTSLVDAAAQASAPMVIEAARVSKRSPEGFWTLTEAERELKISKRVLGRLGLGSESYAYGRVGAGGHMLLKSERVREAVHCLRAALTQPTVAQRIGAPSYMIPAFTDRGFLAPVVDGDAAQLSPWPLYDSTSFERLVERVKGLPSSDGFSFDRSATLLLARRFSPSAWVNALEAALKGEAGWWYDAEGVSSCPKRRGLLGKIMLDDEHVEAFFAAQSDEYPPDATVTGAEAATLLGLDPRHIASLIRSRLLRGVPDGQGWALIVCDLADFTRRYVTGAEHNQLLGMGKPSAFGSRDHMLTSGEDALSLPGLPIWSREEHAETFGTGAMAPWRLPLASRVRR